MTLARGFDPDSPRGLSKVTQTLYPGGPTSGAGR